MRYAVLLLPFALACGSITGTERDQADLATSSRIRFVLDGASCRGAVSLDFQIDKQRPEAKALFGGDSVEFRTSPGPHTVLVRGSIDGLVDGGWHSVDVEAPVRVVLGC